jgi:hypothetical protein
MSSAAACAYAGEYAHLLSLLGVGLDSQVNWIYSYHAEDLGPWLDRLMGRRRPCS